MTTQDPTFLKSIVDSFYNNIILENRYLLILDGLKTTGIISIFSVLLGSLLGVLICFMRMSKRKFLKIAAQMYISILRGIPILVFLMFIYYVVFARLNIDPILVAVIAFGMVFAAYVAEMFRMSIESIDRGQNEAGIAGGFTKLQTFTYIIMPQAIRKVLPVYQGELISLVKMTSIVGYIAVQDLTKASDIIRSRTFDAFFPLIMTAVLYFAISWMLVLLLGAVERKTDPKQGKHVIKKNSLHQGTVLVLFLFMAFSAFLLISRPAVHQYSIEANGQISELYQLDGKRICVITGTTGDFVVRERYQNAQVLDMLYPADAALAVKTNKADAFVFDKSTLLYLVAKSKNKFEIIPEKLSSVDIAIPMRPDDQALHQSINAEIEKFKSDGTLDEMYQKWFLKNQDDTTDMPEVPLNGKNGTLKMGTCLLAEPFAFLSHGEMVGFDIELAYRIAEDLKVKLEITDMSYDAMISALQSGKIDFAIANFYKLEEREKVFEFSVPYLKNDISAMVRKEN